MANDERRLRAKMLNLARLHFARVDLNMARRLTESAMATPLERGDPLSVAYHAAVVVTYARPFTMTRRKGGLGPLSPKWGRFNDAGLQSTHEQILEQRNEVIAHTDLRRRPICLYAADTLLPSGIFAVAPGIMTMTESLEPVSYRAIQLNCLDLLPRLEVAFNEAYFDRFPDGFHGPPLQLVDPDDWRP